MDGPLSIDAFFAPSHVADGDVDGRVALVIDVIRATTCITEAIANGARGIFPTASIEEARSSKKPGCSSKRSVRK